MRTMAVLFLLAVVSGCTNYVHKKQCNDPVGGYQSCTHYMQYETQSACVGSCAVKKK